MDAVKSLLTPLSGSLASSGLMDGMKLVVLGGTVETARRASSSAWNSFVNSFFLTAHFSEEDYPYDWLLHWLQKQPAWGRSREFETTTCTVTANGNSNRKGLGGEEFEDELEEHFEEDDGRSKLKVVFQPTHDTTHTIYYKGHWLRIRRSRKTDGSELQMLSISVVARNNTVLKQLVLQAKREYEADTVHRVQIYFADSHGGWRWSDSRHRRPMSSIVLGPGVKEMLLADAKDFLRSENWYAGRGIPYRRGYLLYGAPGSGKSSLIHALAGELALDIYVVSLSASWMNDSTLTNLLGRVPARSILLLEDLDAAFTQSTSRDSDSTGAPEGGKAGPETKDGEDANGNNKKDINTLSLSGLLNSLDSIQASEGRLLFATTNHLERLDPALSRPGRMDVWVEFKNASKYQAEQLFKNFFPSAEEFEVTTESTPVTPAGSTPTTSTPSTPQPTGAITSHEAAPSLEHATSYGTTPLDAARLAELATVFSEAIPEEEFSVAALQGYLLKNKTRPEAAALDAGKWVIAERALRERLAREKEEKERKEREAREKRRREREEKLAKEKEEKEEKLRREREEREAKEKREREEREEKERKEKEEKLKKEEQEKAKSEAANAEKPKTTTSDSVAPSEDGFEKVD